MKLTTYQTTYKMKRFFNKFRRKKTPEPPKEVAAKFRDVYAVEAFLAPFAREEVKACRVKPGNDVINGHKCPENLNSLTIGEIMDLSEMQGDSLALFRVCAEKVLHCTPEDADVLKLPAPKVYGFINFARSELERIKGLFDTLKTEPTPEEQEAGINDLNFGMFGMLDSYALRMGITSHDEAAKTPWLNVFACLRIDNATREYRKRLNEIVQHKMATR